MLPIPMCWVRVYFIDFITVKTRQSLAIPGCKIVTYLLAFKALLKNMSALHLVPLFLDFCTDKWSVPD